MKIRLLVDLPIDPVFGMTKGRIVEVDEYTPGQGRGSARWWVKEKGKRIGVLSHEAEVVNEAPQLQK